MALVLCRCVACVCWGCSYGETSLRGISIVVVLFVLSSGDLKSLQNSQFTIIRALLTYIEYQMVRRNNQKMKHQHILQYLMYTGYRPDHQSVSLLCIRSSVELYQRPIFPKISPIQNMKLTHEDAKPCYCAHVHFPRKKFLRSEYIHNKRPHNCSKILSLLLAAWHSQSVLVHSVCTPKVYKYQQVPSVRGARNKFP